MPTYDIEAFKQALSESEARLGAPAGSFVRQAMAESSFDPKVISGEVKSSAGATGLMQFMPETAKEYGLDATDPMASIAAHEEMTRRLNAKYDGDWEKTFAAYNWGEGNLDQEGLGNAPEETRGYLEKILSSAETPQPQAAPPSWTEIAGSQEYQQFDDEEKREARNAYFDAAIAPQLQPDQFDEARVIFEEQTRPSESDFFGGLSDLGSTLADAPTHIGAAAARAIEGDEPILGGTDDWTDRIIAESERLTAEDLRKPGSRDTFLPGIPREAVRTLGQNLGFSVTSMGAGVATGLATGAVTGPVGGFVAGGAASGAVANRAAKNSFTRQIYASVNEDWQKSHNGEDIPLKEWAKKKAEVQDVINEHGLFEAVPEAIGNVAGLGLIVKSLTKVLGKSAAKNFIAKATGVLGTEMATETVTQIGQRGTEVDVGLADEGERLSFSKGEDWLTAAKEVAPSVILLTAFTGGVAAVGAKAHRTFLSDPKASQTVQDAAASDDLSVVPDGVLAQVLTRAEDLQERRPDDEPLAEAIKVFKTEQTRREEDESVKAEQETQTVTGPLSSAPKTRRVEIPVGEAAKIDKMRETPSRHEEAARKRMESALGSVARDEARQAADGIVEVEEVPSEPQETSQEAPPTAKMGDLGFALQKAAVVRKKKEVKDWKKKQAAARAARKQTPAQVAAEVTTKAHEAATSPKNDLPAPTDAQIKVGNYQKGHVQVEGLHIAIENPAGSTRSGVDSGGQKWSVKMDQHYGYIKRSEGADGDQVDVFVNPKPYAMAADIPQAGKKVFVIDQKNPTTGKFDEHKVMVGFQTKGQAKAAYMANYAKDWAGFSGITTLDIPAFKTWLKDGDTTKPLVFSKKPKAAPKPKVKTGEKYTPPAAPQEAVIAKAARDYGDIKAYRRHLRGRLGAVEYAKAEKRIEAAWDELRGPARLFSRDKGAASAGNTVEKLTTTLARQLKKLAPFVKVNIVQTTADLPFSAPSDTKGGYYRGEAYLVADNTSEKEAASIFQHEVVGHLGLEQMLGKEKMAEVVAQVQALKAAGNPDIIDALQHIDDTHGALPADIEAKEVLAYLAQKGIKNSLLRKVVAWIRQFFARLGFGNYDSAVIERMIADAARFVERPQKGAPTSPADQGPLFARAKKAYNYRSEGISEETHGVLTEIIDTLKAAKDGEVDGKPIATQMTEEFNQWDKWVGTLDNLIRKNVASGRVSPADSALLQQYMKDAKGLQMDRDETLAKTNDAVVAYNGLGATNLWGKLSGKPTEQQTRLSKALFEGTQENVDYSGDLATLKEKYGLEDRTVDAYLTIRKYFDQSMREYQVRILQRVGFSPRQAETLVSGGEVTTEESGHAQAIIDLGRQIVKDFTELKGYFPLMRHGNFVVSVKNDRGDLVYFSAQESKTANAAELGRIRRKYDATHTVSRGRLEEQTGDAMVMDPRMLSMLKEYADQAGDAGVKNFADEIEQKMLKTFSERTFRKRFLHRSGVPGYDPDIVRSMASYGWSSSNYLSKMRFIPKLKDARASLSPTAMPQIRTKLGEDIQYLEQPGEEYAGFKSVTFAMYMGLNVKSALVNLTQIPLTLYPYLASRYGDAKSTTAIMRAQKQTMRNKPTGDAQLDALLKWAETEGLTMDQYLSELIGAARGKRAAMARGRSKMLESMTFMFSAAEKWNRRVSVAATYHLEKKNFKPEDWVNGVPPAALKELVADAVQKTQFDYGKFNRPKAFRGIGGIPLQFNQFMVNYLQFLAGNGGGAGARNRSLAVLFGMVGIMGLPFADDARAFIEYLMTKATGKHTDLELAARRNLVNLAKEFMSDADARRAAEFVLRGHGAILPVDLTGSLTVGNPVPGFAKFFDTAGSRGVAAGATAAAKQIAGAGPSLVFNAGKGFDEFARAGDPLRTAETVMPVVAIKNVFKAIRVGHAGVDRSATGGINVAYTPTEIDVIAQALSFQPSQRSMLYRMRNVGHREEAFLRMAHDKMMTPLAIAIAEGDIVRRQRALQVIVAWNREVPNKWKLSMKKVQRSIKARSRTFEITPRAETGVRTRQLRRSAQEGVDLFPDR